MSGTQPRLGYQIDTSGLVNAKAAQDALMASGVRLGQTADNTALKVSQIGKDTHGQLQTATNDVAALERQLAAAAAAAEKAKKALPPNWHQMSQGGRTAWTFNNQGAWGELNKSQQEVERLSKTLAEARSNSAELGGAMDVAAGRASFMGGAFGAVAGIIAFQFVGAIGSAIAELGRIPLESARAADSVAMLGARLRFAFGGSAEAARQAREDIMRIADAAGRPYQQVADEYADIAIAGRSAGLSRGQVSGLANSFSTLGLISGADSNRIGRALWQVQQGIAVGRLTYQDYRLAAASLPAMDDALAAGLNVDPSRIPGMISRGEINTEKLVEGLTRGVEILSQTADGMPETMERASNRLKNEWEMLMTDLGQSLRSSQFFQDLIGLAGGAVASWRRPFMSDEQWLNSGAPTNEITPWGSRSINAMGTPINVGDPNGDLARARGEVTRYNSAEARAARDNAVTLEQERARRAAVGQAITQAQGLDPLGAARADLTSTIDVLERGLAQASDPADIAAIRQGIGRARAQLAQIMSGFARALQEARQAEQDLAQYGAANFDVVSRARSVVSSSASEGNPIGMDAAINLVMRQRLTGAESEAALGAEEIRRRQGLIDASGGSVTDRRRAQIDYETDRYAAQFGDQRLSGDPDLASRAGALILQFRNNQAAKFAQEDVQALRERERLDNERLEDLRGQLALGVQLGQQGRIALAQAERERDLRRRFPEISAELVAAERDRVAELIRVNEQLALQQEQMGYLTDAAQTAGAAAGNALRHGIIEGVRSGTLRAADFFDVLEDSALRVADRIMAAFLAPMEKQATGFFEGVLSNLPGMGDLFGGSSVSIGPMMPTLPELPLPGYASGVRNAPGGMAWVGEAGPELMEIPRGANIYTAAQSRAMAANGGGSNVAIQIIDQRSGGAAVETQEERGPDGMRQVKLFIRDEMKSNVRSGAIAPEMRSTFGASRAIKQV